MESIIYLAPLAGVISLLFAGIFARSVLKEEAGSEKMQEIASAIQEGAMAYLNRQYRTIAVVAAILAVLIFVLLPDGTKIAIGFLVGAISSALAGYIGMNVSVRANVRTAHAASKGLQKAMSVAFRGGAVTGLAVVGLALLGTSGFYILYGDVDLVIGFGFGASLISLFARVGGGIFTKAADVGADLVGKIEAGIPEDDPRNAAVIADNVGDNVGDCAGMAADIFESYEVTIVSALILGLALVRLTGHLNWIVYPLLVRGIGVLSSIIGTYLVKGQKEGGAPEAMKAIFGGFLTSAAISTALFLVVAFFYMRDVPGGWWRPFLSTAVGVGLAIVIDRVTDYFTGTEGAPVKEIKESADGGPATFVMSGLASGYESTVWATVVIAITIFITILIYGNVPGYNTGFDQFSFILYGVAMAGIGMLTLTGNNVAMDSFGPISDNANGIGEMANLDDKARQIMADLDAVGNTTKAITKGVAIASAVIAAVSLFSSYITDVARVQNSLINEYGMDIEVLTSIRISDIKVFVGLLLGGALPWLFSSLSIRSVTRAAGKVVEEVRRQFKLPGIMEGTIKPDYAQVVDISTASAQKELIPLAIIAVVMPLLIGLVLQVEALGGFQVGVILSGQLLAVFMANSGGAWDNAKKTIEDEPRNLVENTGKGSERHKAGVVGDTVGDPLKDTAGPALNPMIKVVNLVSLIAAPVIVRYQDLGILGWVIVAVLLASVTWAISQSKKSVAIK